MLPNKIMSQKSVIWFSKFTYNERQRYYEKYSISAVF